MPWQLIAKIVWLGILALSLARGMFLYDKEKHRGCYEVYSTTGQNWIDAKSLYQHKKATDPFRYTPLVTVLFTPLTLVPPAVGSVMVRLLNWLVLVLGMAWWSIGLVTDSRNEQRWAKWWLLSAAIGISSLLDIQFNMFTIGLMMISVAACYEKKWNLAAFASGLAICFKAYPIALALLLFILYPRQLILRLLGVLAILLLLPYAFQSSAYVTQQYREMLDEFLYERQFLLWYHDLMYLWNHWVGPMSRQEYTVLSILAGGVSALAIWRLSYRVPTRDVLIGTFGVASAWMMAFGPASESTTYVMLMPAASLAMLQAWYGTSSLAWRLTALLAYLLLILSQLQMIIPLNDVFHQMGAQPIAALLLLPVFAYWPNSLAAKVEHQMI